MLHRSLSLDIQLMILTSGEEFYDFDLISEHSEIKAIVKFSLFTIRIIS